MVPLGGGRRQPEVQGPPGPQSGEGRSCAAPGGQPRTGRVAGGQGVPRPARGATRATGTRPLEVPPALPTPVVGGQRSLRGHHQWPAAAGDRLGAAGQGAEHPSSPGPRSSAACACPASISTPPAGRFTLYCATAIGQRRWRCWRNCPTNAAKPGNRRTTAEGNGCRWSDVGSPSCRFAA